MVSGLLIISEANPYRISANGSKEDFNSDNYLTKHISRPVNIIFREEQKREASQKSFLEYQDITRVKEKHIGKKMLEIRDEMQIMASTSIP